MTNQDWVVELTFTTHQPVDSDTLEALDTEGDPHDWYTASHPSGLTVSVYADSEDPSSLAQWASEQTSKWLTGHGVKGAVSELRVVTEHQRHAEAESPTMPALVSASGAAEILGVRRQRVHQLHKDNARFPAPLVELATGPVWDEKAIEWFNSVWERKPGRPKNPAKTIQGKAQPYVKTSGNVHNLGSYRVSKSTTTKPRPAAAKPTRKPANG